MTRKSLSPRYAVGRGEGEGPFGELRDVPISLSPRPSPLVTGESGRCAFAGVTFIYAPLKLRNEATVVPDEVFAAAPRPTYIVGGAVARVTVPAVVQVTPSAL